MKFISYLLLISNVLTTLPFADEKPETAWETYSESENNSKYVFGAIRVAPNIIHILSDESNPDDDTDFKPRPSINDLAPIIKNNQLPKCLPKAHRYNDISKLLTKSGVSLGKGEWTLLSNGLGGDNHVYYCLNRINADVLESIMMSLEPQRPFNFHQLATLISVENPGFKNKAWTIEQLDKEQPQIHARLGMTCRSGERTWTHFETKNPKSGGLYLFELTPDAEHRFVDCRIEFTSEIGKNEPLVIDQQTSFTCNLNKTFILDCGVHGKSKRNYLLKIETRELPGLFPSYQHQPNRKYIDKIEGIYALSKPNATGKSQRAYTTHTYRCQNGFLKRLRLILHTSSTDEDDPFGDSNSLEQKEIPAPIRITPQKNHPHFQTADKIFDVTPQFKLLGLEPYSGEWVHYNATRNQLVIHGAVSIHSRTTNCMETINGTPRITRINARVVSVNYQQEKEWTLDLIKQSAPLIIAHYSTIARSGERATFGEPMAEHRTKDAKTGKTKTSYDYEFEIEPTISANNQIVDLRFEIHSKPLGPEKFTTEIESALSIPDGKPAIIEIGHPTSGKRTHLLILNADIIFPDGSFYRTRFKPVK